MWKYFVSNLWRIKNREWKILKDYKMKQWHHMVRLFWDGWRKSVKNYLVHRIVYCTFNDIDYWFWLDWVWSKWFWLVLHKDNNPSNNSLDNLYLWTQKVNMMQRNRDWRWFIRKVYWESHQWCKYKNWQIDEAKRMCKSWFKKNTIWRLLCINTSTLYKVIEWKSRQYW